MITYVFMIIYECMPVVSCQVASGPVMSCHELQCNITHALMQFGPTFQAFQCPAIPPSEASTVHLLSGLCQSTAVGPTMPSTWGMAASANASNIISRILYASIYLRMLLDRDCRYLKKGCGIVLGILFFFFGIFFFFWLGVVLGLSRLLFGKTQGWKAGSSGFFRTFGGGFRAVQAPFWGNQWWNAGSIQVWTQTTASKSKLSRSFLFSVCIYLCWCVCVCVCDRVCSMCFLSVVALIFHSMHFFSCICNLSI